MSQKLNGIHCAVVTPLRDGAPDFDALQRHIQTLEGEGCDGVLLLGTTGEGPSMGIAERREIVAAAAAVKGSMTLMAGTGTPSLTDTLQVTRDAFEQGADVAVVLPPYYFKKVSDEGLFAYFACVIDEAVPDDRSLMAYHIPPVSQMPVSLELIERLLTAYPGRFGSVKDSGGDLAHTQELCRRFPGLQVMAGTDKNLLPALQGGAAGCITAAANVIAPLAIDVYHAYREGGEPDALQGRLTAARSLLDDYAPAPPTLKALLALRYSTHGWEVRPPLMPLPQDRLASLVESLHALELGERLPWMRSLSV